MWRKPARKPQNKISSKTKTNVPHFSEWKTDCNSLSDKSTRLFSGERQ